MRHEVGARDQRVAIRLVAVAADPAPVERCGYRVVQSYPHDTTSFTQGLFWDDGHLYEGTGQYGRSRVARLDLKTGRALAQLVVQGQCDFADLSQLKLDRFNKETTIAQNKRDFAARFALAQGRPVVVVRPDDPGDLDVTGADALLTMGAVRARSTADVVEALGLAKGGA